MDKAKVVFGTTAACRSNALRWVIQEENDIEVKIWGPTKNIADEAACANFSNFF